MPPKNSLKEYKENTYYHIYNRGVAKGDIFKTVDDYKTFLGYLKLYLSLPKTLDLQGDSLKVAPSRQLKNHAETIKLMAYCLMPNHFHLFIFQKEEMSMNYFMRSLATKYSMYFNRKYKRVGPLFQGTYKAVEITSEEQYIYLSKYIHRNPTDLAPSGRLPEGFLEDYRYSSYANYLGLFKQSWVNTDEILSYFSKINSRNSYKNFVEETDESDIIRIKNVVLDI
ncbi:MAG: transposase [Candidatus Beckwithbacteria bacterium]|nr:transposase [Patescibacteria group bacterium]